MNRPLDAALRDEVMALRKKVVMLETADSDNERLRKEMTKIKRNMQEEQSKFELDFMNQLSEVVRENAAKVEEITDELRQAKESNRALREKLRSKDPCSQPITSILEFDEVEKLRSELRDAEKSRDNLFKKLKESTRLYNDLRRSRTPPRKNPEKPNGIELSRFREENRSLKHTIESLQKENGDMKVTLNEYKAKQASDSCNGEKDAIIAELKNEIQQLKNAAIRMEKESRDLNNSSRNDSRAEQIREPGRPHSPELRGNPDFRENRTTLITKQLEEKFKNEGQKKKSSLEKRDRYFDLQKDTKIQELETELCSTKGSLALEKSKLRKQEKDLNSKLEALRDTLSNAEISRTALTLDKDRLMAQTNLLAEEKNTLEQQAKSQHQQLTLDNERLLAQANLLQEEKQALEKQAKSQHQQLTLDIERLTAQTNLLKEEKVELEQQAKRQHDQLKQLQQLVEKHLKEVDKNHKNDAVEIQNQREQVETLKRELQHSQYQVRQLKKTIETTEEAENTAENIVKLNVQSLQTQLQTLQKQLTLRNTELSELQRKYKKEINALESALNSTRLNLRSSMETRDKDIEKLRTLAEEKENEARALEKGKEQLVLSMQDMVKNRRDEVDEYQNEMIEMSKKLANETRKVSTLRSRLEQSDYPAKEMSRLRKRVTELTRQVEANSAAENREIRRKLKDALSQQSILEDKLKCKFGNGDHPKSSTQQALQERNEALEDEVERLTRKLRKLQPTRSEMQQPFLVEDHGVMQPTRSEMQQPFLVEDHGVTKMMI